MTEVVTTGLLRRINLLSNRLDALPCYPVNSLKALKAEIYDNKMKKI